MSGIRNIVSPKAQATLKLEMLKVDPSSLKASNGYLLVNIRDKRKGTGGNVAQGYKQLRLRLEDILTLPGIAANLPTEDPKVFGSFWVDDGFLKVSQG